MQKPTYAFASSGFSPFVASGLGDTVACRRGFAWLDYFSEIHIDNNFINSSSLRPETKEFTCGKWIIDYNFGIDDSVELKFGTHKELIVLNILKYKYCVNKSRDMSRDHFAKNRILLTNWWPV